MIEAEEKVKVVHEVWQKALTYAIICG